MRIVIGGAGETGVALATRFSGMGWDVVLVDVDASVLAEAEESLDVMNLVGDATHRAVLRRAGAPRADAFVAVSGSDGQNMLSAALARGLGAKVAIARVDDPDFFAPEVRLETDLLGVDVVVCTPRLLAGRLLDWVLCTHFDTVDSFALQSIRIGVLQAASAPSLARHNASAIKLPKGVQLAAVLRDGFVRPPTEIGHVQKDDRVVLAGTPDGVAKAWRQLVPGVAEARAIVIGGGDVGVSVVELLAPHVKRLELVELDRGQAQCLAEDLRDVTVLCGDGRRNAFLEDLQIDSASFVSAATANDETNLLIALLARRLGVAQTFTIIREPGHAELFRAVGIEGATGLFEVLARAAQDTITGRGIVRRVPVPGTSYELIEWRLATEKTSGSAPSVDEVPLPARCRIVAAAHDFTAIPVTPATRLHPGDSLVILAPETGVADLERHLARFDKGRTK